MVTKDGLDCGALPAMMESLEYQVCPESQDPQDIRHTQGVWELRWRECLMGKWDLSPCYQDHGVRLEQEDLRDQTVHLDMLDQQDLLEKSEIQDIWVHLGRGDLRALQENQVKMESQEHQEMLETWDSLDLRDPEDFQEHQDLLD